MRKINQKFIWLKVASANISCSTYSAWLHHISDGAIIKLLLNEITKVSLNQKGLLLIKNHFQNT
jgi:hypothetical protein